MKTRIANAPELFMVAIDKDTGEIAGFLNGVATDEEIFRDEFFTDISQHKPNGKNVMLLGLDVLPQYRGQGLAREIVSQYSKREKANQRKMLILTCGINGSYVFTPGVVSFQETPKVPVADTVGAGDSFTAAFCASILNGKPVPEAHKLAVEVSAYVCTQSGAMPELPQVLKDRLL